MVVSFALFSLPSDSLPARMDARVVDYIKPNATATATKINTTRNTKQTATTRPTFAIAAAAVVAAINSSVSEIVFMSQEPVARPCADPFPVADDVVRKMAYVEVRAQRNSHKRAARSIQVGQC